MRSSHTTVLALALAAATLAAASPRPTQAPDSTQAVTMQVNELLAPILAARQPGTRSRRSPTRRLASGAHSSRSGSGSDRWS
jgi:hypothetical protein